MKHKKVVLSVLVFVILVLAVLYIKTMNGERHTSGLEIAQKLSKNSPTHSTAGSTWPVNSNEGNVTSADVAQERLQVSDQSNSSRDLINATPPLDCISLWLEDDLSINETLRCIADYANETSVRE